MTRRIGLMGGTFDPIHYGHLVTAEEVRGLFALERVIFIPSGQPPHKAPGGVTAAEHRYLMTVLATMSNPYFDVSRLDIDRPGPSYTVDTLAAARERLGPEVELYFITGADALLEILTWKSPERLLSMCRFVAATRPGYPVERMEMVAGELFRRYQSRVQVVSVPAMAISSSDIRERVRTGRPIRYLVPEPVAEYIYKHRLYVEDPRGVGGGEPARQAGPRAGEPTAGPRTGGAAAGPRPEEAIPGPRAGESTAGPPVGEATPGCRSR